MSVSFPVSFSNKQCIVHLGKYIPTRAVCDMLGTNLACINNTLPKDQIHRINDVDNVQQFATFLTLQTFELFLTKHWDNATRAKAAVEEISRKLNLLPPAAFDWSTKPAWLDEFTSQIFQTINDNAVFSCMDSEEFKKAVDVRVEREANAVGLNLEELSKEYLPLIETEMHREIAAHVRAKIAQEKNALINAPLSIDLV